MSEEAVRPHHGRGSRPSCYCGQCGRMVGEDDVFKCSGCGVSKCRDCVEKVRECWYCGHVTVVDGCIP